VFASYFFTGAGCGAGLIGNCCVCVCGAGCPGGLTGTGTDLCAGSGADDGEVSSTLDPKPADFVAMIDNVIEVNIKMIAETVVAFDNNVADPRGPNAVCDPMPPKAPARSAAFPLCSKTTTIRKTQTIM